MEKNSKKTYSIFLPLVHHMQQLRAHYFLYDYIIFIVEAGFLLSLPFSHSKAHSDAVLATVARVAFRLSRNIWNGSFGIRLCCTLSPSCSSSSWLSSPLPSCASSQRKNSITPPLIA